jgi:KaiC/GvpD/RAD55 family RecA-like ATPase
MANYKYHKSCDNCGSSDGCAVYDDGSLHCFVCSFTVPSKEYIEEHKPKNNRTRQKEKVMVVDKIEKAEKTKPIITQEERDNLKEVTGIDGTEYRGISAETHKFFGVRTFFDSEGNPVEQYYPCTQDGKLTGYKKRELPKKFGGNIGRTGKECELFGQFRFQQPNSKYCLIVGGEVDVLSAYQMLDQYRKSKNQDFDTVVVSPTVGETGSEKQLALQYEWFNQFEKIVVGFDSDEPGQEAALKAVRALPKGKVFIANWTMKDPNEFLKSSEERTFISDFFNAKKYVPTGVLASDQLYDRILSQSAVARVPFPQFMSELNDLFAGGLPLGHIINVAADTGLGKTTLVNEMIYDWIFTSPHKVGVVSMELDAGQYGEVLLSRHLSRKLALIGNSEEKISYLKSETVRNKADDLFTNEEGVARFYLLDNRDGSIEEIQETVEQLVISCGCKLIVLDPLQDILDGLSNEEQAVFMKWAKSMIKSHGITFVFINHMRKTPAGQSGADSEQNIMGSSTIIKSASANILLKRDKTSEDPIERNTTYIIVTKNRICGLTGDAGSMYYENETHTLWNRDHYFTNVVG